LQFFPIPLNLYANIILNRSSFPYSHLLLTNIYYSYNIGYTLYIFIKYHTKISQSVNCPPLVQNKGSSTNAALCFIIIYIINVILMLFLLNICLKSFLIYQNFYLYFQFNVTTFINFSLCLTYGSLSFSYSHATLAFIRRRLLRAQHFYLAHCRRSCPAPSSSSQHPDFLAWL